MKNLWRVVLLILISTSAFANNGAATNEMISDNISCEFVTCAGYFSMASEAMRNAGKEEAAQKYHDGSDTALKYAVTAAEKSRSNDMAQKVTFERYALVLKSMVIMIDNDFRNFSILVKKYADRCQEVMVNPDAMMKECEDR